MAVINVILSGGIGSRLWPLSRKSCPKQYIPLFKGQTLFQVCALRNNKCSDNIVVVGNADNYLLSRLNLQESALDSYTEIVEAIPRNTAAAIAFAALNANPDDILLVTPSDHIITDQKLYENAVKRAIRWANEGYLVTFGVKPERPETGYGYIEYEGEDVISFREKPSFSDAQQYVNSGRFLWNSGIFCFKAAVFLQELRLYEPEIHDKSAIAWESRNGAFLNEMLSAAIPSMSVDYAVMERSQKIKVLPAGFGWNDLGSFDALWNYMEQDGFMEKVPNLVLGSSKHVEFIGVSDLIYVETEEAVLILNRSNSQDVKQVYERLEQQNPHLLA